MLVLVVPQVGHSTCAVALSGPIRLPNIEWPTVHAFLLALSIQEQLILDRRDRHVLSPARASSKGYSAALKFHWIEVCRH